MKLEMRGQMRLEQRMKLAPHMIQSMEILQLPILALQERIEQELNSNPVLEIAEPAADEETETSKEQSTESTDEKDSAAADDEKIEDFERIDSLDDDYKDYMSQAGTLGSRGGDDVDRKLEAIKNTAAPAQSLNEYLVKQWGLVEVEPAIKKAGSLIIDYIDNRGYLTVRLEQLHNKDESAFTFKDLQKALSLVQTLEPAGIGARDLKECLLLQLNQNGESTDFEIRLVSEYLDELLANHLPVIAKKMDCDMEQLNRAIHHMSRLDTSPGLQIGRDRNHPVTTDIIVEFSEELDDFVVRLADSNLPSLRINDYYSKMVKGAETNKKTKEFLQNNIRSAQWILDAIEQRNTTLLKVAKVVVKYQKDFFKKGSLHLRPLPMAKVAKDVGVHIATISRAVAGKYVQCSWGIIPLRKFFSGGTEDGNGKGYSWEAVRAELQKIIDAEDKSKPLSDDKIRKKLAEAGINNMARRTISKYRKLLSIPAARFRRKY